MRTKYIFFAAIAIAVGTALYFLPVGTLITDFVQWIQNNRAVAWPVYIVAYVIATVLVLPGTILTLAAGFVFGLPVGVMIVSLSSVLGATCAFLVGRYLARDWVAARVANFPKFSALDKATQSDGLLIVLLVRLSPLFPFNITNYGLGLTAIRLGDYVLASWIGMLPGTVLYVYIGTLILSITELTSGNVPSLSANRYLLYAGFILTIVLAAIIAKRAARLLNEKLVAVKKIDTKTNDE